MKITIERFKRIKKASIELGPVNIFIGTNNSGKSSFIQGIQFAISSGQTLHLKQARWVKGNSRTLSLDSTEYLYAPTRYIENLYHGQRLTGARTRGERNSIQFIFTTETGESRIILSRGKNGGFTTTILGKYLGEKLSDINSPFCVYVPGIAGIPIEEKYEVPFAIKKSATRGDSNNYLRNILLEISKDAAKWNNLINSVNRIYENTNITIGFDPQQSEFIDVYIQTEDNKLPIDSIGTGLLQTIQVFAYIEYFNPELILLDEPDAHIHPTKQKMLAEELFSRTQQNQNLKIVFSTHSRYILDALEDKAKVFHFQKGEAIPDIKGSKILIDIGAADADYLFSKKTLKYIIVTEDKVDNINEKKAFIKKFALANGLQEDEFVLHSYEGCTKVDFAKILQGFVAKQIPSVNVIVHFDRDQRNEDDTDIAKLQADCISRGLKLFITKFSEIESYYCQPEHIAHVYNLTIEESKQLYDSLLADLEIETKRKISNFILRDRPHLTHNNDGKPDIEIIEKLTTEWYQKNKLVSTPGKELLGKIKNQIQSTFKQDPNLITNISDGLICNRFQEIVK